MKSFRLLNLVAVALITSPALFVATARADYWDYSLGAIVYSNVRLPSYGLFIYGATNINSMALSSTTFAAANTNPALSGTILINSSPPEANWSVLGPQSPQPTLSINPNSSVSGGLTSGVFNTTLPPTSADLQALIMTLKAGLGSIDTSILPQLAGTTINTDSNSAVPEPSTLMLMGLAVASLAAAQRFVRRGA